MKPQPKVAAAGIAGVATTMIVVLLGQLGVTLDAGAQSALTSAVMFLAAYIKPA